MVSAGLIDLGGALEAGTEVLPAMGHEPDEQRRKGASGFGHLGEFGVTTGEAVAPRGDFFTSACAGFHAFDEAEGVVQWHAVANEQRKGGSDLREAGFAERWYAPAKEPTRGWNDENGGGK